MKHHLNHIILHDGTMYHLFERMGKNVPFEAYNPEKSIFSASSLEEVINFPQNVDDSDVKSSGIFIPPRWDIEEKPYEVMFND